MVRVFAQYFTIFFQMCAIARRIYQLANRKDYLEGNIYGIAIWGGARTEVHLPRLMKIYTEPGLRSYKLVYDIPDMQHTLMQLN